MNDNLGQKIVFFHEGYYKGGVDTFILNLLKNWPGTNDTITLAVNSNNPSLWIYKKQLQNSKIEVISLEYFQLISFSNKLRKFIKFNLLYKILVKVIGLFYKYFFLHIYINQFKTYFFNKNSNHLIVVNGGYPASLSCRAASIAWGKLNKENKSIHNFHNLSCPSKKINWWENHVDRLVNKYTSVFLSVSEHACNSILNRYSINEKTKLKYIYNGIAPLKPDNTSSVKQELHLENKKVCLMLGTFEKRKGHAFLLDAFNQVVKKVPNAVLLIAGQGDITQTSAINLKIINLGLEKNVQLIGFRTDIANLLDTTDVLLISSQENESFGLTAIEAMALKKPVVATNIGGIPEVVKNNVCGYCVDFQDKKKYAESIITLLQNESLSKRFGIQGYERYLNLFTAQKMANSYYNLINNVTLR